jgi:hypothetical protein
MIVIILNMTVIILNMTVIILTTCAVLILTVFFAAPMGWKSCRADERGVR